MDSRALKIRFSNKSIYNKNYPKNNSSGKLYEISEKIRYELLGSKMLMGIKKNLENWRNKQTKSVKKKPN